MIPSVLAAQLQQGVADFLNTTFPVATPAFHSLLADFLNQPGNLCKGPYVSIGLPFRKGKTGADYFPDIPLAFPPYRHQEDAFRRLGGPEPRSTLIATGTGSGKTECFLFPILDYCYRHRGEKGVKAILIYPMNALASDQALRLAGLIHGNDKLRGQISAGLFIGQREHDPARSMGPNNIITDKPTQREHPPDILLTNYKMLDYLLIRPRDTALWRHNGSETLRFLVVDELHTFDGAQGTDLACLIRRLKARLNTPPRFLCCAGTSATLGDPDDAKPLCNYAGAVFGEPFEDNAVIAEDRQSVGDFLGEGLIRYLDVPPPERMDELSPQHYASNEDYFRAQHALWFDEPIDGLFSAADWRLALANKLRAHVFFQNLLRSQARLGSDVASYASLLAELRRVTPALERAGPAYGYRLLDSLLALLAEACSPSTSGTLTPFLQLRVQFWLRELRRMVASVSDTPVLCYHDDLTPDQVRTHLPVVHCRDCGSTGWGARLARDGRTLDPDLQAFYSGFFKGERRTRFLFPEAEPQRDASGEMLHLCLACLNLQAPRTGNVCNTCGHETLLTVFTPDTETKRQERVISTHDCPYCGARDSLTILGSRAASLTSVLIAQLYASEFNDDKKLLTFSDSVQDAAHRAGFFAARTWRFNLRTALQRVVQQHDDGMPLAELPAAFTRYWSEQLPEDAYVTTFLAPNMHWLRDYDALQREGRLPADSRLRRDIDQRLHWEIYSEYGFSARIGRTLEKSGCSIIHVDSARLNAAAAALLPVLNNEIEALRDLDTETLTRFLLGLLVHLKNQGAILHPILDAYIQNGGDTYLITQHRIVWMPNFGPRTRAPVFLTDRDGRGRFETLLSRRSWCQRWAEKCFPDAPMISAEADRLYHATLRLLTEQEILAEIAARERRVWGLRPESLRVTTAVRQLRCDACGHQLAVAATDPATTMHCQRGACAGRYHAHAAGEDYYGALYTTGDVATVVAAEHTGLLERDEREVLEREFKAPADLRKPWFPNLLSCTPKLEMGIDIGDLSTVILCSAPPTQASFLQRSGRAGRRDGNALTATIARGAPHDLYFYAEPETMMAGRIEPPGVFLDASAVLERQLTAFCFDRWVATSAGALPDKLAAVLNQLEPVAPERFPHNWLRFVDNHRTALLDGFLALFQDELSPESREHLRLFLEGDERDMGSLRWRVSHDLLLQRKQRDALSRKVRTLNERIRRKSRDPVRGQNYAEELNELQREKSALQALIKSINNKDTLNFFTDEGLLPNYAFPEAGVLLKSIIYRRVETRDDGTNRYEHWSYDYERPAASAIAELAPSNVFYAGGRRVRIDQIDMATSEIELWRFCDCCHYAERLTGDREQTACPGCGSPQWSDTGQKRPMLKLRGVFATTADRDSRIGDDADDREPAFYERRMLVGFDPDQVTHAWRIASDEFPFGFEFIRRITLREINFGEKNELGEKIAIAGNELPRGGFAVCQHCGKVQNARGDIRHDLSCSARNQEGEANLAECVYLYREFTSEAIRILLPVTTFAGSERRLHSFIAALHLGLKRYFGGSIDHLRTTVYEEPVPETHYRKRYLVLYDTVPGGTGYLKQLMRSEQPLLDLFALTLEALTNCTCAMIPDKDGCYSCVYAYRNSYDMEETSRQTAAELLTTLLNLRTHLEPVADLRQVSVHGLFDSELEARFIEALRRTRQDSGAVALGKYVVPGSGKPGYRLTLEGRNWYIEPQVTLGPQEGITVPSKADFLFRPARQTDDCLPIAVFTDGYRHHRRRIGLDMAQRMAIARSGRYHVWSLSWKDVENRFRPQGAYFSNLLRASGPQVGEQNFKSLLEHYGAGPLSDLIRADSFAWLLRFLRQPSACDWRCYAFVQGLVHLTPALAQPDRFTAWRMELEAALPAHIAEVLLQVETPALYGRYTKEAVFQLFAACPQVGLQNGASDQLKVAGILADEPDNEGMEADWNGFLRLYNLLQFLPAAFLVTRSGVADGRYESLVIAAESPPTAAETLDDAWRQVTEDVDPDYLALVQYLLDKQWPAPVVGYELADAEGAVAASAELAWEDFKIALLRDDELDGAAVFRKAGWRAQALVWIQENPKDYLDDPGTLKGEQLNEQG